MFRNDYSELCAKEILEAIIKGMDEQNLGYGYDTHTLNAKSLILKEFGLDESSDCYFVTGGTQANMLVISFFLKHYEGVIACDSGHINVHETGAVEGAGHKIYTVPNVDGKINFEQIEKVMMLHTDEHMIKPTMVYISDTTETGTDYTLEELESIRKVCDKYNLKLFIDGARLGVALTIEGSNVTSKDIGRIADIFYVGGTKNGLLSGEAIIFKNHEKDFVYHIKNKGALLAKGFVQGIQYETLFTNGLYYNLAKNSNKTASLLRKGLTDLGYELVGSSRSNQIFVKVNKELGTKLIDKFGLELWENGDEKIVVRFVTSFATKIDDVNEVLQYLKENI